ncbi:MAG TPA: DUF1707 domain-containing protein [Streptosporangiaceae bacterium]|nr:DUF1707 domain-containing protein [Streptosporangiaceae bacterium]
MSASWGSPWTAKAASRIRSVYPQADLRVSDAERSEVADRLAEHYADGRLDHTEFTERVEQAMNAKTQSDLRPLLADLPPKDPPPGPPPAALRRRDWRQGRPSGFSRLIRVLVLVLAVLVVASVVQGMLHTLFFWGFSTWVWVALAVFLVWRLTAHRRC